MKKTIFTSIIMLIFSIIPTQIIAQTQNSKAIAANINWNGHMCNGGVGICTIDSDTSKASANTQVSFDKANKELTFVFFKSNLDQSNKSKILHKKLEKGFYLYTFEQDFVLPQALKDAFADYKFN